VKAPVLAFFGRKEAFIPNAEVDEFRDALKKAESVEIRVCAICDRARTQRTLLSVRWR
jgi:hypothetical protein